MSEKDRIRLDGWDENDSRLNSPFVAVANDTGNEETPQKSHGKTVEALIHARETVVHAKETVKHTTDTVVTKVKKIAVGMLLTYFAAATLVDAYTGEGLTGRIHNSIIGAFQDTQTCNTGDFPIRRLLCEKSGDGQGLEYYVSGPPVTKIQPPQ